MPDEQSNNKEYISVLQKKKGLFSLREKKKKKKKKNTFWIAENIISIELSAPKQ